MSQRYILGLVVAILIAFSPDIADLQETGLHSTSPLFSNEESPVGQPLVVGPAASGIITFSEYPAGTSISNQYAGQGVVFGGDNPFITPDGANPTSPVLSGSPRFRGAIEGRFVDPDDEITPVIVKSFTLDAGYFDEIASTRIEWFDPDGNRLGQRTNTQFGIERFEITGGNIAHFRIAIIETEPAGYAIDNVSFDPVLASVLFREKSGDDKDGTWGFSLMKYRDSITTH